MGKNIIICSDGTGNTTVKNRGTNVFKLFEAVNTHHATPQTTIYDDGVGSGTSKISQILGGAFGYGLSRNVCQLYTSLVRNYDPDDKIYLFGFSRGAFTVRSLAGMICHMGILDRNLCKTDAELNARVKHAYREYRRSKRALLETLLSGLFFSPVRSLKNVLSNKEKLPSAAKFKNDLCTRNKDNNKLIHFIGVWDTVSAVGFPVPWVTDFFNTVIYRFSFSNNNLHDEVEQACHALSIDDQRKTFHPEIWNEEKPEDRKRIEQVWFSGVHSNVGGGYPKQGLSLVALNWMMRKADDAGLKFIKHDMDLYTVKQNVYDKLYDSRHGLSVYYRFKPRDIYSMCKQHHVEPFIHSSAINRIYQGTGGYAPGNIPKDFVLNDTNKISCHWPNASTEVSEALGNDTSLLKRVWFRYGMRKISHFIFFLASLYAVYEFYLNDPKGVIERGASSFPIDLMKYLFTQGECWFGVSCVLPIIAVFYLYLTYNKEKMHTKYSAFWYSLIKKHKNKL